MIYMYTHEGPYLVYIALDSRCWGCGTSVASFFPEVTQILGTKSAFLVSMSITDIVESEEHDLQRSLFWDMGENIGLINYTHWQLGLRMFNQRSQTHVICSLQSFLNPHDLLLWLSVWVWKSSPVITVLLSSVTHCQFWICFCLLHKSTTEHP